MCKDLAKGGGEAREDKVDLGVEGIGLEGGSPSNMSARLSEGDVSRVSCYGSW